MNSNVSSIRTQRADIGILGTGRMGVRLALMFARAGRTVVLGSRDRARSQRIVDGLKVAGIVAGTYEEAVVAPAVLPAAFIRDGLFDTLDVLRDRLEDKLLIDITKAAQRNCRSGSLARASWVHSRTYGGKCSTRPTSTVYSATFSS
jgi:predicted dinucleotide-binding enzyme